jgi:hypothetical protein
MKSRLVLLLAFSFLLGGCEDNEVPLAAVPVQVGDDVDRETTLQLREELFCMRSLSRQAKNVRIMTINGVVTLTGPVKSPEEKEIVLRTVQAYPNVRQIIDHIDVVP